MNARINFAIEKLQLAQQLFIANNHDERIVDLLTDAVGAIGDAIADAVNPIGPPSELPPPSDL